MTDSQFAEIIARALVMALRAMNRRYGLSIWVLDSDERKRIARAMNGDSGPCAQALRCVLEE